VSPRLRFALALGWTLAIVAGCSIPGDAFPQLTLLSQDKLLHLAAFAGFALLWARVFPDAGGRILLGGIALGLATEVYQHLMPIGRFFDPFDALADTVGLLLALGARHIWLRVAPSRARTILD